MWKDNSLQTLPFMWWKNLFFFLLILKAYTKLPNAEEGTPASEKENEHSCCDKNTW